jgi:hypothetical protein
MSFINPPYALLAGYHFINYTNARLSGKNGEGPPASVSPGAYFAWDTQIPVTLIGLTAAGLLYALRLWCVPSIASLVFTARVVLFR